MGNGYVDEENARLEHDIAAREMEIARLSQTIDKMAEYIAKSDIDIDICKPILEKKGRCYPTCVECVKDYFATQGGVTNE